MVRDRLSCLVPADWQGRRGAWLWSVSKHQPSPPLLLVIPFPSTQADCTLLATEIVSGTGLRSCRQATGSGLSLLRWWQHRLDLSQKVLGIPQENSTPREWSRLRGRKNSEKHGRQDEDKWGRGPGLSYASVSCIITGFTKVLWPQEELSDNSPVFENSQGIQQVNAVQDTS